MYSLRHLVGGQRVLGLADRFKDGAKARQRTELVRVQAQRLADVLDGGAEEPGVVLGLGAQVVGFGEIRRMIDQGGQMFGRATKIARVDRRAAAFQQQVQRGRAGTRPLPRQV